MKIQEEQKIRATLTQVNKCYNNIHPIIPPYILYFGAVLLQEG